MCDTTFICPRCQADALRIQFSMEILADKRWDEISLQVIICDSCRWRGIAVYNESRRGKLDEEIWEHSGYMVSDEDINTLTELMHGCCDRQNRRCGCSSHQRLSRKDSSGEWAGTKDMKISGHFEMILSNPPADQQVG